MALIITTLRFLNKEIMNSVMIPKKNFIERFLIIILLKMDVCPIISVLVFDLSQLATNETKNYMPMPIDLAHKLMIQQSTMRRSSYPDRWYPEWVDRNYRHLTCCFLFWHEFSVSFNYFLGTLFVLKQPKRKENNHQRLFTEEAAAAAADNAK